MQRALNWILMLATLAATVGLYWIKYDTRMLEARVEAQERALEKAENDVRVLTAERAHLARPERLEPLARALGLGPIGAGQYLRLDERAGSVLPPAQREGRKAQPKSASSGG